MMFCLQEAAEAQAALDRFKEEMSDTMDTIEMATLDKEMAEEKLESANLEIESLKEKIEELTLENQIMKDEQANTRMRHFVNRHHVNWSFSLNRLQCIAF